MECTSLEATEHRVLAALTVLPGRVKEVPYRYWDALGLDSGDVSQALQHLRREVSFIEVKAPGAYTIKCSCNCSFKGSAKRSLRMYKRGLAQPEETYPLHTEDFYNGDEAVDEERVRTNVRTPITQPLRSRGGDGEPEASTDVYRQLAGKRVSGHRVAPSVASKRKRRNTPSEWRDLPVERWNSVHLAGYFDAQTEEHLWGVSADRYVTMPMRRHFAQLMREGITAAECKQMVDLFVQQESSHDGRVDSLWRRFIAQRGRLARLLTSNAGRQYNNQPRGDGTHDDDEERWL